MKHCHESQTTNLIPFSQETFLSASCTQHFGEHPETADDYMWLIKLADMGHDKDVIKSVYAEVMYQRKKAEGHTPEDFIVPLMRVMRDFHQPFYQEAKRFIEQKYDELFPGQEPVVAPDVMDSLRGLAEGRD